MLCITAPDSIDGIVGKSLFLAGGITACPDWQSEVIARLADSQSSSQLTILNPRRAHFDVNDRNAAPKQIAWEWNALRRADIISFWFPACDARQTVQPIALFELGRWSTKPLNRPIVVGADPDYPRRFDVVHQLGLERPLLPIASSLSEFIRMIEMALQLENGTCRCPFCEALRVHHGTSIQGDSSGNACTP